MFSVFTRAKQLENRIDLSKRLIDLGVAFYVVDDDLRRTGERSQVYGGMYDIELGAYISGSENPISFAVSRNQFEFIVCDSARQLGKGGRGSGKSEALAYKAIRYLLELDGEHGRIVSPINDLTVIVLEKVLAKLDPQWISNFSKVKKTITLWNRSSIQFRSGKSERALRSWGGSWQGLDEEADITDKVIGICWGCLRLTKTPIMFGVGTPVRGQFEKRYIQAISDADSGVFSFPSRGNPFISHRVFDLMRSQMDERLYRQEVLAEFVDLEDLPFVFYGFDREKHCIRQITEGEDITSQVVFSKTHNKGRNYIIGCDYNWGWPNVAVVFKIYDPDIVVAVDCISSMGHTGQLVKAIQAAGYNPRECLVIDDATGESNARINKGKGSSARLMRAGGFAVHHPRRNPAIKDAVNAVNCKLVPADDSDPTIFFELPKCEELAVAMESCIWKGDMFDKSAGHDHWADAIKYVLHFFFPPAKIPNKWITKKAA